MATKADNHRQEQWNRNGCPPGHSELVFGILSSLEVCEGEAGELVNSRLQNPQKGPMGSVWRTVYIGHYFVSVACNTQLPAKH